MRSRPWGHVRALLIVAGLGMASSLGFAPGTGAIRGGGSGPAGSGGAGATAGGVGKGTRPTRGAGTGIRGVVSDTSGSVVPGATVEVVSKATGQTRTAVTGIDGFYSLPQLNPGLYQVKASLSGFRTSIRDGIDVVVNESARADLQLQVGDGSEQITVSAPSPLVDASHATLRIVFTQHTSFHPPL